MCAAQKDELIVCPQCDMVSGAPELAHRQRARCPRCHAKLFEYKDHNDQYVVSYTFSALVFFVLACTFSFISFDVRSVISETTLPGVQDLLLADRMLPLLLFFTAFIIVIPLYCMFSAILLHSSVKLPTALRIFLTIWLQRLYTWSMAEVFLAGILVSFVKLAVYGRITLGLSFAAYCIFTFLLLKAFLRIDKKSLWDKVAPAPLPEPPVHAGQPALVQGVRRCPVCGAMVDVEKPSCPRCGKIGSIRKQASLQNTLALLICAVVLYFPANIYPVMTTHVLSVDTNATIVGGARLMWQGGSYFVGAVIFTASVLIPITKIIGLTLLCLFAKYKERPAPGQCFFAARAYKVIELVGRWSMIDVFVVTICAALVRVGGIMTIYSRSGIVFFALVVMLTIFAAQAYDPRLIWDRRLIRRDNG